MGSDPELELGEPRSSSSLRGHSDSTAEKVLPSHVTDPGTP